MWLLSGVALVLASFAPSALLASHSRAAPDPSFTVDNTVDAVDISPGNGACASSTGACTLRAAIQEANALPSPSTITVPAGTFTLAIASASEDSSATGDLDITGSLTIEGAGADLTVIDAAALDRVFDISGAGTVTISRMTLRNGQAGASDGGAVRNAGTLTLRSVVIQNNYAHDGGGVSNHGTATITESAIVNNTSGGGNGGGFANFQNATLTNVTLSGNTAHLDGGGASNEGAIDFTNDTIADNTASAPGGGFYENQGAVSFRNTIVALNQGDNCAGPGGYISRGHNLSDTSDCLFMTGGDLSNTDPRLGSLGHNGGPDYTLTQALLPGSPAIDAGDAVGCPPVDQRGVTRPQDGNQTGTARCDIGAFELIPSSSATPTATGVAPTPTATRQPTPPPALSVGDVNCDGRVDSIDAALVLQYSAGLIPALRCQQNADVNHDGQVNSVDAALILQYGAGLIRSLPT